MPGMIGWKDLRDLLNFAGTDAGRTDSHAPARAIHQGANGLQIQVPAALGYIMGVADAIAELRAAATYFTNSCHKTEISLNYFEAQL